MRILRLSLVLMLAGCSQGPTIESLGNEGRRALVITFPEDAEAMEISFWQKPGLELLWGLAVEKEGYIAPIEILEYGAVPKNMRQQHPAKGVRPAALGNGTTILVNASYTKKGSYLVPVRTTRKTYRYVEGLFEELSQNGRSEIR